MENQLNIPITNGVGTLDLANGNYAVTASVNGYDNTTITPPTQTVTNDTNEYNFTIAATGTLVLHVTDNGSETGTPIVGATFIRTDSAGNPYGLAITSDESGNATFPNVPFSTTGNAPLIYYKQTASDNQHEFNPDVQSTSLNNATGTFEVTNSPAVERTFNLTDKNYDGLPITEGNITFSKQA